jgi:hypothetical protein
VNVTIVENVGPSVRGEFRQFVTFELDQPAPRDGYIIQKITLMIGGTTLDGTEFGPSILETYYEAWPVREGEVTSSDDNRIQEGEGNLVGALYHDVWELKLGEDNEDTVLLDGTWEVIGVVRFYAEELPDHFAVGKVTSAGDLLSSYDPPSYWTGSGTVRSVWIEWNYSEVDWRNEIE